MHRRWLSHFTPVILLQLPCQNHAHSILQLYSSCCFLQNVYSRAGVKEGSKRSLRLLLPLMSRRTLHICVVFLSIMRTDGFDKKLATLPSPPQGRLVATWQWVKRFILRSALCFHLLSLPWIITVWDNTCVKVQGVGFIAQVFRFSFWVLYEVVFATSVIMMAQDMHV